MFYAGAGGAGRMELSAITKSRIQHRRTSLLMFDTHLELLRFRPRGARWLGAIE